MVAGVVALYMKRPVSPTIPAYNKRAAFAFSFNLPSKFSTKRVMISEQLEAELSTQQISP